jgi:NADH dehydrogenase [ubiquinone] 1 alpha subcomplex assembly factor 7
VTALADEIKRLIAHEGPISVERYMALALYDECRGYYMTRDPFGEAGDFTTAPEISQVFGELIGLWVAEVARHLPAAGAIRLVELGPGRGTLMADMLRALKVVPELRARLAVHLVETSLVLRARQQAVLRDSGVATTWHARHEEVPAGPAIIVANEFFDALPIRQFVRTERGWCERLIGLGPDGALAFGLAGEADPALRQAAPVGALLEVSPMGLSIVGALARRLAQDAGAALVVDYGHARSGLGETLQAVKRHAFVDPLTEPGEADLTAHVDFSALSAAAHAGGAAVYGPIAQGELLTALGIAQRSARLKQKADARQRADIDAALTRLAGMGERDMDKRDMDKRDMGTLFKAMAIAHPALPPPPGFDRTPAAGDAA